MPKKAATYQQLSEQLDETLARLHADDVHVDEAVELYEKGLQLVAALEAVLASAENTVTRLKLQATQKET